MSRERKSTEYTQELAFRSSMKLVDKLRNPTKASDHDLNDRNTSSAEPVRYFNATRTLVDNAVSRSFGRLDDDIRRIFPMPAPTETQRAINSALVDVGNVFKLANKFPEHINIIDLAVELAVKGMDRVFKEPDDWPALLKVFRTVKSSAALQLTTRIKPKSKPKVHKRARTPSVSPTPSTPFSTHSSSSDNARLESPCPPSRPFNKKSFVDDMHSDPRARMSSPATIPSRTPEPRHESQREHTRFSPQVVPSPRGASGWLEDRVQRTMRKKLRRLSRDGWQTFA